MWIPLTSRYPEAARVRRAGSKFFGATTRSISRSIRSDAAGELLSNSQVAPFSRPACNPALAKIDPICRHCRRTRSLRAAFRACSNARYSRTSIGRYSHKWRREKLVHKAGTIRCLFASETTTSQSSLGFPIAFLISRVSSGESETERHRSRNSKAMLLRLITHQTKVALAVAVQDYMRASKI